MNHHQLTSTSLFLFTCGALAAACGDNFDSCTDTGSCGTAAGAAGRGGAAGAAGRGGAAGASAARGGTSGNSGAAGSTMGGTTAAGTAGNAATAAGAAGDEGGAGESSGGAPPASGGSGGESDNAGRGGEAHHDGGEAGRPTNSECQTAEDCTDHLFCTGEETCESGRCVNGAPPCANPDPTNCTVTCEEGSTQALCSVAGQDGDNDGFTSATCQANPGNDCDDGDSDVHPDATELCDGIDNDCNGKADLNDGLALAGDETTIENTTAINLAWDARNDEFFVLRTAGAITKGSLAPTGTLAFAEEPIAANALGALAVPGAESTLILYYPVSSNSIYHLQTIDLNGSASPVTNAFLNRTVDVAWRAKASDWLLAFNRTTSNAIKITVSRILGDLTIEHGSSLDLLASSISISAADQSAIVFQNSGTSQIHWALVSDSLEINPPALLTTSGHQPDITSMPEGYAMAWTTATGLAFAIAEADGTPVCVEDSVPLGLTAASDGNRVELAYTSRGVLALVTAEDAGQVMLVRFGNDCEVLDLVPVASRSEAASPAIAAGEGYVGLAWQGGDARAFVRVMSDRLCE